MEDKKIKEELDEHFEPKSSGISCESCPIDSVIQKILGIFRNKN